MAKSVLDMAPQGTAQSLAARISGSALRHETKPWPSGGREAFKKQSHCNMAIFGDQGTGKTTMIVQLLLEGYKIYAVNTDFARTSFDTVRNWFKNNPEHDSLLDNLRFVDLKYEGFTDFVRDPASIDNEIYTFDPDILFWDGASAFQQSDLEEYIGNMDPLRSERKSGEVSQQRSEGLVLEQSDWGMVKNGTLKPALKFLELHNVVTGKPWSKIVTFLEEEKSDYKDGKKVEGTAKTGPLLHGAARKVIMAGFSVGLRAKKSKFGKDIKYQYLNEGDDLMVKDRGFQLPSTLDGDAGRLWKDYIEPKIRAQE